MSKLETNKNCERVYYRVRFSPPPRMSNKPHKPQPIGADPVNIRDLKVNDICYCADFIVGKEPQRSKFFRVMSPANVLQKEPAIKIEFIK